MWPTSRTSWVPREPGVKRQRESSLALAGGISLESARPATSPQGGGPTHFWCRAPKAAEAIVQRRGGFP